MARYRSRPREIEAVQWDGSHWAMLPNAFHEHVNPSGKTLLTCYTKQGPVQAVKGDYLILGDGEVYPCKSDEFEKRYEPVDEMQQFGTAGEEHG